MRQLPPVAYPLWLSRGLELYYKASDHPCKLRLLNWIEQLAGRKRIAVRTRWGFRVAVDRRDYIQKSVFDRGDWESEISVFMAANLRPDDVLFDIGANVGYFSCLALQLGVRSVVAFEPSAELSAIYRCNMQLNRFDESRWTLLPFALSSEDQEMGYISGPLENSGQGRLDPGIESGERVPARRLDALCAERALPAPTVIKLDVEGWEPQVLAGSSALLEKSLPRWIIFETDCDAECRISDRGLASLFESHGYSIKHLERTPCELKENYVAMREPG